MPFIHYSPKPEVVGSFDPVVAKDLAGIVCGTYSSFSEITLDRYGGKYSCSEASELADAVQTFLRTVDTDGLMPPAGFLAIATSIRDDLLEANNQGPTFDWHVDARGDGGQHLLGASSHTTVFACGLIEIDYAIAQKARGCELTPIELALDARDSHVLSQLNGIECFRPVPGSIVHASINAIHRADVSPYATDLVVPMPEHRLLISALRNSFPADA